jgi:hypothetical protein
MPLARFVLNVTGIDSYSPGLLFRSIIDLLIGHYLARITLGTVHSNSRSKGGLAMVNMPDGSYVDMWLCSFKLGFSHHFLLVNIPK